MHEVSKDKRLSMNKRVNTGCGITKEGALWFAFSDCFRECLLKWKKSLVYGLASPFINSDPREILACLCLHRNSKGHTL